MANQEYAKEQSKINKKYMDRDKLHLRTLQQKEEQLHTLQQDFDQWKAATDVMLLEESNEKLHNTEK